MFPLGVREGEVATVPLWKSLRFAGGFSSLWTWALDVTFNPAKNGGDGHLAQCDLAEEEFCSQKATSRRKSKLGESMNVPLEHCFRL